MSADEYIEAGPVEEIDARRSASDEIIVAKLAAGGTYEEAGAAADVSSKTVQRRMADAAFRQRVFQLRDVYVSRLTGRLLDGASDAIDVIQEEMRDGERGTDRVRAARTLLEFGTRFRRAYEVDERLALLEERLGLTSPAEPSPESDGGAA